MRVSLKLEDGSEEVRDVASFSMLLGGWSLEVTPDQGPLSVHLQVHSRQDGYCSFVVRHRCANTMTVEIEPHATPEQGDDPLPRALRA
jgi:hypothetical protein